MRRVLQNAVPALVSAVLLWAPLTAWASEGTGRSPVYDLVMKFVNFGILAGILFYFLRKPVSQGLADRRENIRRELEEARQAKAAAEARYREYKERVANLEAEIRQLRADFETEGERQKERIIAEGRQAAESVRRQAEATGANEVKRARDELRAEVADLAVQLAEELLRKAYTVDDQKKAVQATIANVERIH